MRSSVSTVWSLLRERRRVEFQRVWPHAQVAYVTARSMGGYEGGIEAFIPEWARLDASKPRVFISRTVDGSVRMALALGLVSQDVLDELTLAGFEA